MPEGPYYWIRNGAESPNEMFFDEPTEGLNIDSSKDGKEFDQEFCRLIRVLFREEMPALDRSALHVVRPVSPDAERAALLLVKCIIANFASARAQPSEIGIT